MPRLTQLEKCKRDLAKIGASQACAACGGTGHFNLAKIGGENFWACNKAACQETIRTAIERVYGK